MQAGWGLLHHLPLPSLLAFFFSQTECPREAGTGHSTLPTDGHVNILPLALSGRSAGQLVLTAPLTFSAPRCGRTGVLETAADFSQ